MIKIISAHCFLHVETATQLQQQVGYYSDRSYADDAQVSDVDGNSLSSSRHQFVAELMHFCGSVHREPRTCE